MALGVPQLIIILVIALIIFGPKKLPELGASVGKTIKEFKSSTKEVTDSIAQPIKEITDELAKPIQEIKQDVINPIKESMDGLDLNLNVGNPLQEVTNSFENIKREVSSSFTSDGTN